ncbi:MAG: AMP-binding protein [Crocinitomicaceae bacterium]|nr:AMP-binding protein [Crocinitomicaceae bacterium]
MKIEFVTVDPIRINDVCSFVNEWNSDLDFIESKTSGSTGRPKTIRLLKKHMIASAKMTGEFLGLKANDSALLCMTTEAISGKMMIVRAIVLDLKLIVTDITSTPLKNSNQKIDFAAMVPMQVEGSLKELHLINKLIVGGGTISNHLWNAISESEVLAYQTFGMTETISHIAMRRISKELTNYNVLPGVEIADENGCLTIKAPMLGVENLQTNDQVEISKDGSFKWLGRKDFVINSGGIKIHPELVEDKLTVLIQQPFFVIGLPDDTFGEKLILCIEGDAAILKSELERCLDKFCIPKEVHYFSEFLRTASGKINRLKTIERLADAKKQVL